MAYPFFDEPISEHAWRSLQPERSRALQQPIVEAFWGRVVLLC